MFRAFIVSKLVFEGAFISTPRNFHLLPPLENDVFGGHYFGGVTNSTGASISANRVCIFDERHHTCKKPQGCPLISMLKVDYSNICVRVQILRESVLPWSVRQDLCCFGLDWDLCQLLNALYTFQFDWWRMEYRSIFLDGLLAWTFLYFCSKNSLIPAINWIVISCMGLCSLGINRYGCLKAAVKSWKSTSAGTYFLSCFHPEILSFHCVNNFDDIHSIRNLQPRTVKQTHLFSSHLFSSRLFTSRLFTSTAKDYVNRCTWRWSDCAEGSTSIFADITLRIVSYNLATKKQIEFNLCTMHIPWTFRSYAPNRD